MGIGWYNQLDGRTNPMARSRVRFFAFAALLASQTWTIAACGMCYGAERLRPFNYLIVGVVVLGGLLPCFILFFWWLAHSWLSVLRSHGLRHACTPQAFPLLIALGGFTFCVTLCPILTILNMVVDFRLFMVDSFFCPDEHTACAFWLVLKRIMLFLMSPIGEVRWCYRRLRVLFTIVCLCLEPRLLLPRAGDSLSIH